MLVSTLLLAFYLYDSSTLTEALWETGNLVPRAFPREEGGERGHCLPIA